MEDRTGSFETWRWDEARQCWEYMMPLRIYPHSDGTFTVSSNNVWHQRSFNSFEDAERSAVEG
jgi:hypothetical protein